MLHNNNHNKYHRNILPPDPKAVDWLQKNTWFGSKEHKDMTGYAYGLHETLIQDEGIYPTTDQYYQEVDKRMRQRFPEFLEKKKPLSTTKNKLLKL